MESENFIQEFDKIRSELNDIKLTVSEIQSKLTRLKSTNSTNLNLKEIADDIIAAHSSLILAKTKI